MKQAVIYARYSPGVKKRDSRSSETQLASCRAHCERKGYRVLIVGHDDEASGGTNDRAGLQRCLEAMPPGGVLVVDDMSRLTRNFLYGLTLVDSLRRRGCSVETVDGSTIESSETAEQRLYRRIKASVDEYYREQVSLLTSRRMVRMQAEGWSVGGTAPYGKRRVKVPPAAGDERERWRLVDDEAEQVVIKRIMRASRAGDSVHSIAKSLSEKGVKNRQGGPITRSLVYKIVKRFGAAPAESSLG